MFLEAFSKATNDDATKQKYRSKNFDITDCTQIDRLVKFSVDALDHAQDNGGKLKAIRGAASVNELGTLMYLSIDLLSRPAHTQTVWGFKPFQKNIQP